VSGKEFVEHGTSTNRNKGGEMTKSMSKWGALSTEHN